MVDGYESRFSGSRSFQDLGALASTFHVSLRTLVADGPFNNNNQTRPLMFTADSLGGSVVKEGMIQMKREDLNHATLDSTYGGLFFGVPSQP